MATANWRLGGTATLAHIGTDQSTAAAGDIFTLSVLTIMASTGFTSGIGNVPWAGTPLASILQKAGITKNGLELEFFRDDEGEQEVREITGMVRVANV